MRRIFKANLVVNVFMMFLIACASAAGSLALAQSGVAQRTAKPSYAPFYDQCHAAHRASSEDVSVQRNRTYECTIAAAVQGGVLQTEAVRECTEEFEAVGSGRQYRILRCAYLHSQGPRLDDRQWRLLVEDVCHARSEIAGHRYQKNRQQCLIDTLLAQRSVPSPARRAECAKNHDREFQCLLEIPR